MNKKRIQIASILCCAAMLSSQASAAMMGSSEPSIEVSSVSYGNVVETDFENIDNLNEDISHVSTQENDAHTEPTVTVLYEGNDCDDDPYEDSLIPETARGKSKPTDFWNLSSKGSYTGSFQDVSSAVLYTNYYFDFLPFTHTMGDLEGVNDGKLYAKYNVYTWDGSKSTCKLKLTLYCKNCNKELISHTSQEAGARDSSSGPVTTILNFTSGSDHKDHFCYFKLQNATRSSSMYGSLKVAHSNSEIYS